MHVRRSDVLSPFKREPDATRWLFRFGLAGPVAIVLWDQLGGLVLPALAVSVVDLLLIMVYGVGLSVMIVRIMHASERWGVESALTARKVASSIHKRGATEDDTTNRSPPPTTGFQEAHFLRRLQEEVATARRDGSQVSLIWLDVNVPGDDPYPAQVEKMATDVAELLASQARTIGASLSLTLNEYVFSLPYHSKAEAREFMRKLVLGLGRYWVHCGISVYPAEASDAQKLYDRARALCDASREGRDEAVQAV